MQTYRPDAPPVRRRSTLSAFAAALRVRHWVKNGFVFAPVVFAGGLFEPGMLLPAAEAFVAFSLASSAVYLLNDLVDAQEDRLHPKKRFRPIAAGELSPPLVMGAVAMISLLAFGVGALSAPRVVLMIAAYGMVNLLYTLRLKHVVILDVFALSAGFVLRVEAGAAAAGVPASTWLLVCTSMLALFLGFSKRRLELAVVADEPTRKVLSDYSPAFLDKMMNLVEAVTVIAYLMYAVAPETEARVGRGMLLTVPFVLYGIFRYQYLVYHRRSADDPTDTLLTDGPLMGAVLGWLAIAAWVAS